MCDKFNEQLLVSQSNADVLHVVAQSDWQLSWPNWQAALEWINHTAVKPDKQTRTFTGTTVARHALTRPSLCLRAAEKQFQPERRLTSFVEQLIRPTVTLMATATEFVLPEKYTDDLKDENGNLMSKRYADAVVAPLWPMLPSSPVHLLLFSEFKKRQKAAQKAKEVAEKAVGTSCCF